MSGRDPPALDPLLGLGLHELKNLLNEAQWRLAERGDCALELSLLRRAVQQLSAILLLQRERAGQLQAMLDAHSPRELLEELAADYRSLFPALQIAVADADDGPWFFDRALLRLALADLVHNACRHARRRVCLSAGGNAAGGCLEVRDDGPGFPAEILGTHGATPAAVGAHGTGLGLYLAAAVVGLHRRGSEAGRLELANADGAVIRLHLP